MSRILCIKIQFLTLTFFKIMRLNIYQQFIIATKYARFNEKAGRRETWPEIVDRWSDYMQTRFPLLKDTYRDEWSMAKSAVLNMEVFPSMRILQTAGYELTPDFDNDIPAYNCAFIAIDNQTAFDHSFYILLNGAGLGFSVEHSEVSKLPPIPVTFLNSSDQKITISKSKESYAAGLGEFIAKLYEGKLCKVEYDGTVSDKDKDVLSELLEKIYTSFQNPSLPTSTGLKLSSLQCHDMMCLISEASTLLDGRVRDNGGALMSLSDLDDIALRQSKSENWWEDAPYRRLANNSAVYNHKPEYDDFLSEWTALKESGSGERGIFNREAFIKKAKRIGRISQPQNLSNPPLVFGVNPCGEILLRSKQFCNLTEAVIRPEDTFESMSRKIKIATFLGTLQADFVNFKYIDSDWNKNCVEERLLGVSLTGIFDNAVLRGTDIPHKQQLPDVLIALKSIATVENVKWADRLGIRQAAAVTTIKPGGTTSKIALASAGVNPSYSAYFLSRISIDKNADLAKWMQNSGVPWEPYHGNDQKIVFKFPIAAPDHAITSPEISAISHLETWHMYSKYFTDHNPSVTIQVQDHEWDNVGQWVWDNWEDACGIAFLPAEGGHVYAQPVLESITYERYLELLNEQPVVDFSNFREAPQAFVPPTGGGCEGPQCELRL